MYTVHHVKFFVAIFLCITNFNPIHCMLSELKHKPCTQQPDRIITIHRDRVEKWVQFSKRGKLDPMKGITIVREATEKEQMRKCFDYAIAQATGNSVRLSMYENYGEPQSTINIEKYFKQTLNAQKNDIVVYTDNEKTNAINHVALVFDPDNTIFESKFGNCTQIIHHQPFAVPITYGDAFSYWTLKPKYKDNKKKLRKTIRDDATSFKNGEPPYKKIKPNLF